MTESPRPNAESDATVQRVIDVLTRHEYVSGNRMSCSCGWWRRPDPEIGESLQDVHRVHLAQHITSVTAPGDQP